MIYFVLVSYVIFLVSLSRKDSAPNPFLGWGVFLLHSITVLVSTTSSLSSGFRFAEYLLVIAWGQSLLLLMLLKRVRFRKILRTGFALVAIQIGCSAYLWTVPLQTKPLPGSNNQFWDGLFLAHILSISLAYGGFLFSTVLDIIFRRRQKQLKSRGEIDLESSPSLSAISRINFLLCLGSSILFSIGLALGLVSAFHLAPQIDRGLLVCRTSVSGLVLFIFSMKTWFLNRPLLRNRYALILGIIGLFFIIISFIGLNFHLGDLHLFSSETGRV